jgi:hypothetical protein
VGLFVCIISTQSTKKSNKGCHISRTKFSTCLISFNVIFVTLSRWIQLTICPVVPRKTVLVWALTLSFSDGSHNLVHYLQCSTEYVLSCGGLALFSKKNATPLLEKEKGSLQFVVFFLSFCVFLRQWAFIFSWLLFSYLRNSLMLPSAFGMHRPRKRLI